MRKAFTLIEMIFVIVIIGLLAGGASDIFLRIFGTYIDSQNQNEMQAKTQLSMDQISNRLTYRIKPSVIVSQAGAYTSIESAGVLAAATYALEWISYDNDSLRGAAPALVSTYLEPGWSGFIDLVNSNTNALNSPGSRTATAQAIMASLSYDTAIPANNVNLTLNAVGNNAVMIFPDAPGVAQQYGWYNSGDTSLVHPIFENGTQNFQPIGASNFSGVANEVYENYQLAFSAYALEYDPGTNQIILYYNYQPWNGETYAADANSAVLVDNVSNFVFTQIGSMLKIQLCVSSDAANPTNPDAYSLCKERAIF